MVRTEDENTVRLWIADVSGRGCLEFLRCIGVPAVQETASANAPPPVEELETEESQDADNHAEASDASSALTPVTGVAEAEIHDPEAESPQSGEQMPPPFGIVHALSPEQRRNDGSHRAADPAMLGRGENHSGDGGIRLHGMAEDV